MVQLEYTETTLQYGRNAVFPIQAVSSRTGYDNIVYSSSDPSVVYIAENGAFSTLTPGTAVLTAAFPQDGNYQVDVTIHVSDEFAWDYQVSDMEIGAGQSRYHYITPYALYSGCTLLSGSWSSSDTSVAQAASGSRGNGCQVTGVSAGTAAITGVISFQVETRAGTKTMTDTVSFQVTVT